MNKSSRNTWMVIQILIVYMFSGLSMGMAITVIKQFPIVIIFLIGFGSLCTLQMLHFCCRNIGYKIFGKMSLNFLGFFIWAVSMFSFHVL